MSSTITGMSNNQQNVTTDVSKNSDERVGTNIVTARLLDKFHAHIQDKGSTMLPERDMSRANADCVEDS